MSRNFQLFGHGSFHGPARTLTVALISAFLLAGGCSSPDEETGNNASSSESSDREDDNASGDLLGGDVDLSSQYRDGSTSDTAARLAAQFAEQRQPKDPDRELEKWAQHLSDSAYKHEKVGFFDSARENREDIVQIRRRLHGDDSWQATSAIIDLNRHKWYAALSDEARRTLKEEASNLEQKAVEYYEQGDYAKATDEVLKVLKIWQDHGGEQQVHYAALLGVLAGYQQRQGEFERAESYHQQSVELFRSLLGERHPHYASILDHLAIMYQDQGRFEKARPTFVRANEIRAETLHTDHLRYALGLNHLAALEQDTGDLRAAAALFQQVLELLAQHEDVGDQHVYYAAALKNLAVVYLEGGDLVEAQSLVTKAMKIHEKTRLGMKHINYAIAKRVMGRIEQQRRDYKKAEDLLQESLNILGRSAARRNPAFAKTQLILGQVYLAQGNYQDAEPALKESLANMQLLLGPSHPKLARNLNSYADLLRKTGRGGEAGTLESRARKIQALMSRRPTRTTQQ